MGDDRTEEHNDPRDVNPKQKEWRSSKGTVNETEAGLSHDCRERHASDSEGDRREETPDKRVPEGDLTIGYCRVQSGQSDRADHEGQQATSMAPMPECCSPPHSLVVANRKARNPKPNPMAAGPKLNTAQ